MWSFIQSTLGAVITFVGGCPREGSRWPRFAEGLEGEQRRHGTLSQAAPSTGGVCELCAWEFLSDILSELMRE